MDPAIILLIVLVIADLCLHITEKYAIKIENKSRLVRVARRIRNNNRRPQNTQRTFGI